MKSISSRQQDACVIAAAENWATLLQLAAEARAAGGGMEEEEELLAEAIAELYDAVRCRQIFTGH